jgi:hypothetical protein
LVTAEPVARVKTFVTPKSIKKIPTEEQLALLAEAVPSPVNLNVVKESNSSEIAKTVEADKFLAAWENFTKSKKDAPADFMVLDRVPLWDQHKNTAILQFESEIMVTNFNKLKPQLLDYLFEQLGLAEVEFEIELIVDPNAEKKMLYTSKDKFDHLVKAHPALMEFVKRLYLELE